MKLLKAITVIDAIKKGLYIIPDNEIEYNEVLRILNKSGITCNYVVRGIPFSERQIIAVWTNGQYCPVVRCADFRAKRITASDFIKSNT